MPTPFVSFPAGISLPKPNFWLGLEPNEDTHPHPPHALYLVASIVYRPWIKGENMIYLSQSF